MTEPYPPYQPHSDTSRFAAALIADASLSLRQKVFRYIALCRGATDEEMQLGLQMNPNTQRPRRRELQKLGAICDSGLRRRTSANRDAVVWVVGRSPSCGSVG